MSVLKMNMVEDAKPIGIYRSRENAERAVARLQSQAVFRHHLPGFQIEAYEFRQGSFDGTHFQSWET
jgi:hypothetical protein